MSHRQAEFARQRRYNLHGAPMRHCLVAACVSLFLTTAIAGAETANLLRQPQAPIAIEQSEFGPANDLRAVHLRNDSREVVVMVQFACFRVGIDGRIDRGLGPEIPITNGIEPGNRKMLERRPMNCGALPENVLQIYYFLA